MPQPEDGALAAEPPAAGGVSAPDSARGSLAAELSRLEGIVRALRLRCPWDRQQTHKSLVRHLLEEAYEAMEAIDALSDPPTASEASHFADELGDLLFQVWFHALLASEEGLFDLADVARSLREKLVTRHPHVFGDGTASDARAVVANWERGKLGEGGRTSLMEGIPRATPALAATAKVERKASGAGLGFPVTGDLARLAALFERVTGAGARGAGAPEAGAAGAGAPARETSDEALGDLLFGIARLTADAGEDPEGALRRAAGRFKAQFVATEQAAAGAGATLHELDPEARLALWRATAAPPGGPSG